MATQPYLTQCPCGRTTSRAYARRRGGKCKACVAAAEDRAEDRASAVSSTTATTPAPARTATTICPTTPDGDAAMDAATKVVLSAFALATLSFVVGFGLTMLLTDDDFGSEDAED